MPKGDREKFKADTEDGYTKIADLLLEALAMAKLNGVQKGICIFLWRRTYGWGIKEDRIPLRDFAKACDSSESYISKQLKELEKKKVILRLDAPQGKASVFTINTRVAEWDKGCLNVQGLHDCYSQGLYKCTRQGLNDCARVDTDSDQELQGFEQPLYTDYRQYKHDDDDVNNNAPAREANNIPLTLQREFGRTVSPTEVEKLESYVKRGMSSEVICEAIKRARLQGSPKLSYVEGILKNWWAEQVRDMAGVERVDAEFEKHKNKIKNKEANIRGPTGKTIPGNGGQNKAGQNQKSKKYAAHIPTCGG